jgi:hypothetical protein
LEMGSCFFSQADLDHDLPNLYFLMLVE